MESGEIKLVRREITGQARRVEGAVRSDGLGILRFTTSDHVLNLEIAPDLAKEVRSHLDTMITLMESRLAKKQ